MKRFLLASLLLAAGDAACHAPAAHAASSSAERANLEIMLGGQKLEGTPLFASDRQIMLLGRDGRLWEFDPRSAGNSRKLPARFQPYTTVELRSSLERELGSELEITSTAHFLVAHPKKQGKQWAQRFEDLYRSFVHYFSVRGFKLEEPQFPMVAIVWSRREDFLRYAMEDRSGISQNVLGYYSPMTNRITLYDIKNKSDASDWAENFSTVIHEATHQSAFNTGVHSRYAPPPRWVVEGLGTLFEAPAIWDSRNPRQRDRVNHGRLADFRHFLGRERKPMTFAELISSDRLFDSNPQLAYAEAWAFSYFSVETDSRRYCQYLAKTANRANFTGYTSAQRLADFQAVFGDNFAMWEANFLRYLEQVK